MHRNHGLYDIVFQKDSQTFYTNNDFNGNLNITHFDNENFIISGTFEFTVIDNDGNEIQITDGRFDLNYTN